MKGIFKVFTSSGICIFLLFVLPVTSLEAQSGKALKLYSNHILYSSYDGDIYGKKAKKLQFLAPSIAYELDKGLIYHQFELAANIFSGEVENTEFNSFYGHFRYDLGKQFETIDFQNSKHVFYWGMSSKMFFTNKNSVIQDSIALNFGRRNMALNLSPFVSWKYVFGEHWFFEANVVPFGISIGVERSETDNILVPENNRITLQPFLSVVDEGLVRVAVGYYFVRAVY